ncbi:3-hydroxyacyl-CoA dehydrogenase NAD-binding [Paenibacillus curdlanolyticus YK9]|uniref:3-hydroxyacyl-CoA dehydrogenase NAD-binding n=1 Tax=Paenibacillus curdlanolyticus YK9 TaxID=717606 RepID=E0I7F0_9BACL|nr:3-hydroxyacyl-CoA dehydrogenase family protein [Paenibacillus curdlanolyticus]EFM11966.1 3-hydroxyacyl-CoA dehydrogenase NAD-binding [Paenibacillus curdlanolyticus YK9]
MIRKASVLGAGTIGRGVALFLAQGNLDVTLHDISEQALVQAREELENQLRLLALTGRGRVEAFAGTIDRIRFTLDYEAVSEADFIVENVTEDRAIKAALYRKIDEIASEYCIVAANTSCIPVTELAAHIRRPERVVGIHFMNPVPLISTVEVIRGFHTNEETLGETVELLQALGKQAIVVNDSPGFVSNRVSHLMMNEAMFVLHEQVASAQQVDDLFKQCFGHKMGPLETADLIGLDTVKRSLDVLYDSFQDSKYRCCPLLAQMVAANRLGRKTGAGFYDYA